MEHFDVPFGIQRDAIVCQDELAPLQFGQSFQRDHRDIREPELPRCRQATMAGDNIPVLADENRIRESERADAAGDLRDLRLAMGACIAR